MFSPQSRKEELAEFSSSRMCHFAQWRGIGTLENRCLHQTRSGREEICAPREKAVNAAQWYSHSTPQSVSPLRECGASAARRRFTNGRLAGAEDKEGWLIAARAIMRPEGNQPFKRF